MGEKEREMDRAKGGGGGRASSNACSPADKAWWEGEGQESDRHVSKG